MLSMPSEQKITRRTMRTVASAKFVAGPVPGTSVRLGRRHARRPASIVSGRNRLERFTLGDTGRGRVA
jgi:hypothetical protein